MKLETATSNNIQMKIEFPKIYVDLLQQTSNDYEIGN